MIRTLVCALALVVSCISSARTQSFEAYLTGGSHAPAVLSLGSGNVTATLSGNSLAVSGDFEGLDGAYVSAAIESGYAGRSGTVQFVLNGIIDGTLRNGSFTAGANTFILSAAQQTMLAERRLYVNIKTDLYPAGELRGQILPEADEYFEAPLSGGQAIPTAPTSATGSVIVELTGTTVKIHGSFNDLGTAVNTSNEAGVHIHWTRFGDSGNTIRQVLTAVYDDASKKSGVFRADDNTFVINEFSRDLLRDRQWYADVHTLKWGLGELRGQLFPMSQLYFQGRMQDWNVIDPIDSGASVGILGELKDDTLTASGTFLPLMDTVLSLHIHRGFPWQNGPEVYPLTPTFISAKKNHGFVLPLENRFALTPAQIEDLLDRRLYADIHTVEFPEGEVRATFVPAPNNPPPMPSLVLPPDNELIVNAPESTPSLFVDWTSVTDPEDDPVAYLWQLSRGDAFTSSELVYNINAGNTSNFALSGLVLDSLLAADTVAVGETKTYYHRAIAFDGSVHHRTFFDQRLIQIQRGASPGNNLTFAGSVFLEGAFVPGSGLTTSPLYDAALHAEASDQPFSRPEFVGSPLEYHGTETLDPSTNAIGWLLLSLHTEPSLLSEVWRRAVLVKSSGQIIDGTGSTPIELPALPYSSLWIVLRERNHIGVMSSSAVDFSSGTGSWNFRAGVAKAYSVDGPGMKLMPNDKAAMFAGDVFHDGQVTATDFNKWLVDTKAAVTGYVQSDMNLDGQVTASDFNLWLVNTKLGVSQQIPD